MLEGICGGSRCLGEAGRLLTLVFRGDDARSLQTLFFKDLRDFPTNVTWNYKALILWVGVAYWMLECLSYWNSTRN